jgi:hypothetical protein
MTMIRVVHGVCGGPAFLVTERPVRGTPMRIETIKHLDGSPVTGGTRRICGSCGKPFEPFSLMPDGGYAEPRN